jgi:RecB family exonuclease
MKPFIRWSASQVDTYNTCNRKWWFSKILGIETPPHPSAVIGTEVHAQLEAYLEEKAPADSLGPIARTALPFAPRPGTVYIEQSIEELGLVAGGLPALGYIDVLDLTSDPPQVLDWKTTSNFRYAKTEDELLRNVQMSVYAKATLAMCERFDVPAPTSVRVTHVAMLTKPPHEARRTSALMPTPVIQENWKSIDRTVLNMRETATLTTPDKVTPTKSACSAYGGCPFLDRCRALEATRSIFAGLGSAQSNDPTDDTETTMPTDPAAKTSLLAKLGVKTKSSTTPAPATPAPEAPVAPAAAPAPAAGNAADALMARLRGNLAKPPAAVAPVLPTPRPVIERPVVIVPPDAPTDADVLEHIERSDTKAEETALEKKASRASGAARRPRNAGPRLAELGYPEDVVASLSNEEMHTILDEGTRYAVAEAPVDEAPIAAQEDDAVVTVTYTLPPVEVARNELLEVLKEGYDEGYQKGYADAAQELKEDIRAEVLASLPKASQPLAEGLRLYVDCRPLKADGVVELDAYLAPLMAKVAENAKVPHYSMIPYAQGPAQVAALVSTKPPTGILVADTRLPATNAVLEVLLPYAVEVVRGLR